MSVFGCKRPVAEHGQIVVYETLGSRHTCFFGMREPSGRSQPSHRMRAANSTLSVSPDDRPRLGLLTPSRGPRGWCCHRAHIARPRRPGCCGRGVLEVRISYVVTLPCAKFKLCNGSPRTESLTGCGVWLGGDHPAAPRPRAPAAARRRSVSLCCLGWVFLSVSHVVLCKAGHAGNASLSRRHARPARGRPHVCVTTRHTCQQLYSTHTRRIVRARRAFEQRPPCLMTCYGADSVATLVVSLEHRDAIHQLVGMHTCSGHPCPCTDCTCSSPYVV
jgi:hypothetical protein